MKLAIEWHYETAKKHATVFKSEALPAAHAYLLVEDILKTGRVKEIIMTDEHDSTWTLKELKKYLNELETEPHDVTVYFDGGFNREQNLSGLGAVIFFKQSGKSYRIRVNLQAEYLTSNNEAEYAALYFAIEQLEEMGVHHQAIQVFGDSQVVINELNGEWAVTDTVLSKWADKIEQRLAKLALKANFTYVERNKNSEADQLANQALNGIVIHAQKDIRKR